MMMMMMMMMMMILATGDIRFYRQNYNSNILINS